MGRVDGGTAQTQNHPFPAAFAPPEEGLVKDEDKVHEKAVHTCKAPQEKDVGGVLVHSVSKETTTAGTIKNKNCMKVRTRSTLDCLGTA